MREAIILCGGKSLRMKPFYKWNKGLLPLGKYTLLSRQILWLSKHGFNHIIIATNEETWNKWRERDFLITEEAWIEKSLEWKKLGTSGAVLRAGDLLHSDKVYVMNVDDIILDFNPLELYNELERGGIIALHKPKIGFGLVRMKNGLITRFQEKPYIKYWVSCGHYVFRRDIIRDYFVEIGDLEKEVLPRLAKDKLLQGYKIRKEWITINTYKDYLNALDRLKLKKMTNL